MQPMPPDVQAAFDAFPLKARHRLVEIRAMIFALGADDARIGAITETLKWGEPAYLTEVTGSGSTIRLGVRRGRPDRVAIYFICRTSLVDRFRERFGDGFDYEGTRAVLLPVGGGIPLGPLEVMLTMALTYHLRAD
ncbi:DUF1801 domain-containing protein [Rhizobium sp.]